jgi:hypothetical protein
MLITLYQGDWMKMAECVPVLFSAHFYGSQGRKMSTDYIVVLFWWKFTLQYQFILYGFYIVVFLFMTFPVRI